MSVKLESHLFGFIPMGVRTLFFEEVNDERMRLQTREHDPLDSKVGSPYRDRTGWGR